MGLQLYKTDIYSIEHNKRSIKDFELLAFSIVFNKPLTEFFKGVKDFEYFYINKSLSKTEIISYIFIK